MISDGFGMIMDRAERFPIDLNEKCLSLCGGKAVIDLHVRGLGEVGQEYNVNKKKVVLRREAR